MEWYFIAENAIHQCWCRGRKVLAPGGRRKLLLLVPDFAVDVVQHFLEPLAQLLIGGQLGDKLFWRVRHKRGLRRQDASSNSHDVLHRDLRKSAPIFLSIAWQPVVGYVKEKSYLLNQIAQLLSGFALAVRKQLASNIVTQNRPLLQVHENTWKGNIGRYMK